MFISPGEKFIPSRDNWHIESADDSGMLLRHELRGHINAVSHDKVPVSDQALSDVQYDRGRR